MFRRSTLALTLLASAALGLPALAQTAPAAAPDTPAQVEAAPETTAPAPRRMWRKAHGDHARADRWQRRDGHGMRGHAMPRGPMMMMGMLTRTFDADGDGTVTRAEMTEGLAALVARHDVDGDGNLSLEEFATLHAEIMRPLTVRAFQFLDADGDGQVSEAERARAEGMLTRRLPETAPAKAE